MSDIFDHQMDAFDIIEHAMDDGDWHPTQRAKRSERVTPHIFNDGWDEIVEQSKYLPTIEGLRKLRL